MESKHVREDCSIKNGSLLLYMIVYEFVHESMPVRRRISRWQLRLQRNSERSLELCIQKGSLYGIIMGEHGAHTQEEKSGRAV